MKKFQKVRNGILSVIVNISQIKTVIARQVGAVIVISLTIS